MLTKAQLIREYRDTGTLSALPNGHFINGAVVAPEGGARLPSFDPGNCQSFGSFAAGGLAEVNAAVAAAKAAFENIWRDTAPAVRGRILTRAAQLVEERADLLAVVETLDCGKPLNESFADVRGAVRCLEYYAGACDKLQGDSFPLGADYMGYSVLEPVGVTAHVIPWNFPLSTAVRGIAPALAAGCTVVAKPAEQTPFTALLFAEILFEAGLPAGVCNVVTGTGAEAGAPLTQHADVDHITFTGSVRTGQRVMEAAAGEVSRVVLELGGKSPVVVLKDSEQQKALDGVLGAIFENAGQICSAGARLIIEKDIHQSFVAQLVERAKSLEIGHGLADPALGPVNSAAHLNTIASFVARARDRGAKILCGGSPIAAPDGSEGWFYPPTIIDMVEAKDELAQEEIFGPVLVVQVADDAAHALELANDCQYGLAAGIYTANFEQAHQFARRVDAGQVYINEYFAGGIEVPFGGNKKSGFGREKGMEGVKSYTKLKSIVARIG